MKVSKLIKTLQTIDPDAEVRLVARRNPSASPSEEGSGPPIYIAVTNIDGIDKLVLLCNYVDNKQAEPVFDAVPQFKRFRLSTAEGIATAVADLSEQAGCEPTVDLDAHLELEGIKQMVSAVKTIFQEMERPGDDTP
jgi:hypothetical protein